MRRLTLIPAALATLITLALPAGATPPPPVTGTIDCVVAGSGKIKPPLSNTPSNARLKISGTATSSSCNNSGVSGGKAPITSARVKFSLQDEPGYTCTNYDLGWDRSSVLVKWQGLNPAGRTMTVGIDHTTVASFTVDSTNPVTYRLVTKPMTRGPFTGSTITLVTILDDDLATLLNACANGGLGSFGFGHVHTSTLSVP